MYRDPPNFPLGICYLRVLKAILSITRGPMHEFEHRWGPKGAGGAFGGASGTHPALWGGGWMHLLAQDPDLSC